MSQYVTYIQLPRYLSQWLVCRLGDPVTFPPSSAQNAIIRAYLMKTPEGKQPDLPAPGLTAVSIPDSTAKPVEIYNHLSARGKAALAESAKDLFKRALWTDIKLLASSNVGLNNLIGAWCEYNGIDIDGVEAVRQCYYRMRKEFAAKGINLKSFTKKK